MKAVFHENDLFVIFLNRNRTEAKGTDHAIRTGNVKQGLDFHLMGLGRSTTQNFAYTIGQGLRPKWGLNYVFFLFFNLSLLCSIRVLIFYFIAIWVWLSACRRIGAESDSLWFKSFFFFNLFLFWIDTWTRQL